MSGETPSLLAARATPFAHRMQESQEANVLGAPGRPPVVVPPVLYLPVRPHPEVGNYPEVRKLADGRKALLAYTALDRLADACGANQPWVLLHLADLGVIKEDHPFDVVAFDPPIPADLVKDGKLA